MAILQISKIQLRRGQEGITGLPQLDSGELGWAIDSQKLYIGNGSLAEGAPEVGNTEILTNQSLLTIFDYPAYNFQGHSQASPVVTSPNNDSYDIVRPVQEKLDDFVSIYDFGGDADGADAINDLAFQQAINQLYLNSDKADPKSRVALRILAGTYLFTSTIYIPPNVTLLGDGKDKTILVQSSTGTALFQFCDQTSTPGSYVTLGSIQNDTAPQNVNIAGITFKYSSSTNITSTLPLVRIDCAQDSYFVDCKFEGSYIAGTTTASNANYTGIEIRGQNAITTKDLILQNCTFDGLYYAIRSNYDIDDVVVTKSKFQNLNRAVVYADSLVIGNTVGPVRTRFHDNKFINIEREAIYVGNNTASTPTYHKSTYNTFKEVGNVIDGDASSVYSVINFLTPGNVSDGDYFDRFASINNTTTSLTFIPSVNGKSFIDDKTVYTFAITGTAATTLVKLPHNEVDQMFKISYTTIWGTQDITRVGELTIAATTLSGVPSAAITDDYSYVGADDGGLVFSASLSTITNVLSVSCSSTRTSGTITYKYSQLQ